MRFVPNPEKKGDLDLPPIDLAELNRAQAIKDEVVGEELEGFRRAILSGATAGLYDNAAALIDANKEGGTGDYELELLRRKNAAANYRDQSPTLSLLTELGASLPTGVASFKGVSALLQRADQAKQMQKFLGGERTALYKTKNGKLKEVEVEEVLENGQVRIKDGGNAYAVKMDNLTARTSIKGDTPSNAAVGTVEGAGWGFAAGENGDRTDTAVIGALFGVSLGRAMDIFSMASPRPNSVGMRTPADEAADEHMIEFSEEFVGQAQKINDDSLRAAQERDAADLRQWNFNQRQGPRQPTMDYINPVERARGADLYDEAPGLWRSIREGYDKYLTGTSDYIMRRISPQWGAKAQRADEKALRRIGVEVDEYVDPITDVLDLELRDRNFHGLMLDYGRGSATKDEVVDYIKLTLGEEMAVAVRKHLDWSDRKHKEHIKRVSGRDDWMDEDELKSYMHSQLTQAAKKKKFKDEDPQADLDYPSDPGLERRSRGDFKRGEVEPDDYEPVFATNLRRIMNNERTVTMAELFGMPRHAAMTDARQFFRAMERHFVSQGLDPDLVKRGVDAIKDNLMGQSRSPNQWLQALNSLGYATTLAGPKSAILNLQDPMVGAPKYGFRNVMKGMGQDKYDVESRGIRQNVGEFRNRYQDEFADQRAAGKKVADAMRTATDWLMKGSGFAAADSLGKGWTIKGILNHAAELAQSPGKLEEAWGFYFDKAELAVIRKELLKHGSDFNRYSGQAETLLEELAFAGLGQQQLISAMGRPVGWARHPNARPLWALRGFAIKQQALLMREVVEKIRDGKTDEALKYFTRYVALAGGSFGLLNESRQWMFGDGEFTISGMVVGMADQVISAASINTIGLNDYQYGSLMENGLLWTMAEGMVPIAADRPAELVKSMYDAAVAPEGEGAAGLISEVPMLNQGLNFLQNTGEDGLIPQPLAEIERRIRPGEQR
jgi:hypothetical protein